jgi:voltage-gated potassium channel
MTIIGKLKGDKKILPVLAANKALFVLVLITVFFVPVIPMTFHRITYSILLTSIILTGTQLISKHSTLVLSFAVLAIAMLWIGDLMGLEVIKSISKGVNVVLFTFIVIDLVKQVSSAKMVSPKVILESINGYLMIGLVFSLMVGVLMSLNHAAFSFFNTNAFPPQNEFSFHQFIYYAFSTLTTVGYGDVVPMTPEARSLSILISVTGQLYIAIVIALLVGKYIIQEGRPQN